MIHLLGPAPTIPMVHRERFRTLLASLGASGPTEVWFDRLESVARENLSRSLELLRQARRP